MLSAMGKPGAADGTVGSATELVACFGPGGGGNANVGGGGGSAGWLGVAWLGVAFGTRDWMAWNICIMCDIMCCLFCIWTM